MTTLLPSATAHAAHQARQERPRVLAAAQALYFQQGIEAVSMADIARYLSLPEATVLAQFGSKEALVEAVMIAYAAHIQQALLLQKAQSSTAVEEVLALRAWMRQEISQIRDVFFRQLEMHYPGSWQRWLDVRTALLLSHIRGNLRLGIQQELYRESLDVEFLSRLWLQQLNNLRTAGAAGLEPAEVHHTLLEHFLAGIVTPAGAYVSRRLQEGPPFY